MTILRNCALSLLLVGGATLPASAQQGGTAGPTAPRAPGQNPNGMHIYLWAGLKSHNVGQHDYPQFLADWSKILTAHGAICELLWTGLLRPRSSGRR